LSHDKFLIWACAVFGYGAWKEIKAEIKKETSFEFDHYIKSRTEGDLNKRMNSLLKVIETEIKYDVIFILKNYVLIEQIRSKGMII
jgi:predicted negative regulator of RcsB-dependent stress response